MARKKSSSPGIYTKVVDDINDIAYTGTVKVKVVKDNKIYSEKIFKNSGRWPLFYFLAGCLAGDYASMENLRPKYINLFDIKTENDKVPVIDGNTDLKIYFNQEARVSVVTYPYNARPNITRTYDSGVEDQGIGQATTTFKFVIPFTQLQLDNGKIKNVNAVCLYSEYNKINLANPSAFFFVVDPSDKTKLGNLIDDADQINVAYLNEYSLYIEWQLALRNPTTKTN